MKADRAVILVGHGGVPTDCPAQLVSDFKRAEAAARGASTPTLLAADKKLRAWPRTAETDPYQAGLAAIAAALRKALPDHVVYEAYNEFCPPTLEEAMDTAIRNGAKAVTVISTMFTRGGIHSETEIPELISEERRKHPGVDIRYAWPFELPVVADFLAAEVHRAEA